MGKETSNPVAAMVKVQWTKGPVTVVGDATSSIEKVYLQFMIPLMILEDGMGAIGVDLAERRCAYMRQLCGDPAGGGEKPDLDKSDGDSGPFAPYRVTHSRPAKKPGKKT